MKANSITLIVLSLTLLLAACGGDSSGEEPVEPAEQIEAVSAAQQVLADELGVDLESVQLVRVEDQEWSDSCLGLGGAAESCLAAITPGYRVVFQADDKEYTYRTDLEGVEIRLEMIEE